MEARIAYRRMTHLFDKGRTRALRSLLRSIELGLVDPDAIPLLSLLNSLADYYTTSSCSGRIQLAATRLPGEKFRMLVIAKWHEPVSPSALVEVLKACRYEDLWLSVQGPILHVACRSLDAARLLIAAARAAGLKHSGIMSIEGSVMVELIASDRIEAPLRLGGKPVLRDEALIDFVERANEVLLRAKGKLSRLKEALEPLRRNK
ncbi:MAG: hypothetical protein QXG48_01075 [Thermofilaceae archaeon]